MITNQRATEVDGVIDIIRSRGLSIERFNLCQYPENSAFSWAPNTESSNEVVLAGRAGWFHDPGRYTIAHSLEGHGRELALRECDAFWEGATLAAPLSWLNPPDALILSSRKLQQLFRAHELGIPAPPTLVSNDRNTACAFFKKFSGAVVKSLASGYSIYGKEKLKLYSRFYANPPEELLEGLTYSPMVFQKRVPKRRELRVTVVEDHCFGMVADTSGFNSEDVDLRRLDYDTERHRFAGLTVPDHVAAASRKIVASFGLTYAGLDWIEDEHGKWLFLELNCMGAFKWSELCGAGDITTAIADALTQRVKSNDRGK
ncbi:MAG: hypothetical protein KDK08_22505 [Rhizobiaceae bacterium]|nr:hypothetical protein [Rhizobiaceae bacterium]